MNIPPSPLKAWTRLPTRVAVLLALATVLSQAAQATSFDPVSEKLAPGEIRYIAHADRFQPVRSLFKGKVTTSPDEVRDAFREFVDPKAAIDIIQKEHGTEVHSIFAGFQVDDYRGKDDAIITCGASSSSSTGWDQAQDSSKFARSLKGGKYASLRGASREERVRAYARCFANLSSNMPALKPPYRATELKLKIDKGVYALAEKYLKALDLPGTSGTREQYRKAFDCLALHAADGLKEGAGNTVVARLDVVLRDNDDAISAIQSRVKDRKVGWLWLTVTGTQGAKYMEDVDLDHAFGLWPLNIGQAQDGYTIDGNNGGIEQILNGAQKFTQECRSKAGLFAVPPSKIDIGTPPAGPCKP